MLQVCKQLYSITTVADNVMQLFEYHVADDDSTHVQHEMI